MKAADTFSSKSTKFRFQVRERFGDHAVREASTDAEGAGRTDTRDTHVRQNVLKDEERRLAH